MSGLRRVELQGSRETVQNLARHPDPAGLFEPRVPRHTHAGELREFLSAQPRRATASVRVLDADGFRRNPLASVAKEGSELFSLLLGNCHGVLPLNVVRPRRTPSDHNGAPRPYLVQRYMSATGIDRNAPANTPRLQAFLEVFSLRLL